MLAYEKILAEAVKQLNDVVLGLSKAVALTNIATNKANDKALTTQKASEKLLTATEALVVREKAVEGKEKGILAADALTTERNALESQRAFLANEKKAFIKERTKKRGEIEQQISDNDVEKKALASALKDLAEEKKNYKLEILKEFTKKAGK